ncbi:MAG: apolipoprotein N-acyltransferase [Cyclobacteriaceae bacterium]
MKAQKRIFYPIVSGLLLSLAWIDFPIPFVAFVAFIPLFLLEKDFAENQEPKQGWKFFGLIYLAMLIWNLGATWWIWNATPAGALMAFFANSLLMTLPWIGYRFLKKIIGVRMALVAFLAMWLSFENLHFNWALSWPWLTLGNAFATLTQWVQWYEYTGALGGSVWILLINYLIFLILDSGSFGRRKIIVFVLFLVGPIIWSYSLLIETRTRTLPPIKGPETVIVQPNFDPYTQKFGSLSPEQQVDELIRLSREKLTLNTHFLLWPETAVHGTLEESTLEEYRVVLSIKELLAEFPKTQLITGLESWDFSLDQENPSATANIMHDGRYYELYNAVASFQHNKPSQTYHKSKFVPGAESMPLPSLVAKLHLINVAYLANLTGQDERTVFKNESVAVAPAICYESVFGEFMTQFVRNGADYIFVITNDGWWGDTPGYRQHFDYAKLRAIETRRPVVRCANTGISGVISEKGESLMESSWWKQEVLRITLPSVTNDLTFYTRNGNYLGRTAYFIAFFIFISALVKRKTKTLN